MFEFLFRKSFVPLFLALRYLLWSKTGSISKFMTRLCFLGILVSTCSLSLTLVIMSGFEKEISGKIRGMLADAVLLNGDENINWLVLKADILKKADGVIADTCAGSIATILIRDNDGNYSNIILRGVESTKIAKVSEIDNFLIDDVVDGQKYTFDEMRTFKDNSVIVGKKLAQSLGLRAGSEFKIILVEPSSRKALKLTEKTVVASAFLDVGFSDYDTSTILCSLELFGKIFSQKKEVDHLMVKFASERKTPNFFVRLFKKCLAILPFSSSFSEKQYNKTKSIFEQFKVASWQDLYPTLVASLKLEKFSMFLIIALIAFVSLLNIVGTLFMQVNSKQKDIAILKALGFGPNRIVKVFMFFGMTITFVAAVIGNLLAFVLAWFFSTYCKIQLPDSYIVKYLPLDVVAEHFALVFVTILFFGFLASLIPSLKARNTKIFDVLRGSIGT